MPYDPSPPPGVEAGVGVSVDALFTPDNGQTTYTIPAFYYEDFLSETRSGSDWLYPAGAAHWKVRFAPNAPGDWQYRLRVQDSSGELTTQPSSFSVGASSSKGFIKVSADPRYFAFEDGAYFPGLGFNMNYSRIAWDDPISGNQQNFQTMGQNGIQLIRMWLSQWSIYGSSWGPWNPQEPHLDPFWEMLDFETAYPDSEISLLLDATDAATGAECMFWGWERKPLSVKRNTSYRVRVRFKAQGITGPRQAGSPYGFAVKTGGWLWAPESETYCNNPGVGAVQAATYAGGSWSVSPDPQAGWSILQGTIDSGDKDYLDNLFLVLENATGGQVYVDRVWLEESLGGGQYGPNVISKPWMAHHLYFDQRQSFAFDRVIELAEANGVYLRPVVLEKNEDIASRIQPDGTFGPYDGSGNSFYGEGREMTKGRWLQRAWWRYLQARWGYSTSIQSWELLNEGDPFNERHYDLADEFAKYMHSFGPNSHLVSTSFWHSFPKDEFWANAKYPNVDFADIHQYVPQSDPNYGDMAESARLLGTQVGSLTSGGPGKPVIRGETGIVDSGTDPPSGPVSQDAEGTFLHNLIWAQVNPSGVLEPGYWYYSEHIVGGPFDHRGVFKPYYDFIKDVPLTNGRYVDAQATATNSDLRVMGQKDLAGGKAHLWIQNRRHTWKNVVDGLAMGAPSGAVSVGGFQPTSAYTVQWFDTRTGQVASTRSVTSNGQGTLSLAVDSVTADLAVKISGAGGTPPPTEPPPTEPPPTEPPPTGDSSAGWPMAGANPERTSWVSGTGIKSGDVEWFKPFESYISQRTQIIATQDTLFISTSDGLYALDAATGNQKWVYATAMPLGNSPTVAGSVAYVGGTDKKLHAVNVTNGSGLWTFDADGGFLTNPLVVNGIVYAGARDGYLYAVDAADGSLRWKYKTGGEILFSAAYKDGAIYFASNDMRAYALNASTGALIWRSAELPTAGFYSWWPVVHDDAVIIVGTPTYQIHRFGNIWPDTLVKLQIEAYGKGPESPVRSRTGKIEASGPRQIPRGTTVGPMTSVEGNWAPGTAVIDLSKPNAVPGGSTMAVTEYFEQRPYRRTYFVLDRQTGEEKTYDFDGDGQAEYAPILHSGTHSGTRYPPIVGGDGVLYQKTSYLSDQFIPGGHIAGWKYGTPYMSLPAKGSGSNYYWLAEDEPAAYSAIGNVIYYNLCCDRIGAWLDTSKPETPENAGEFFTYSNGFDRSLYEKIPGYRKFWYNPDESNTNAVCGTPEGCYGAFGANSPYGWHGNQNPPVPYKGRVYMHRGNSVIAIGTAGGRVQKPAATAASASYSVNIPSKNELQDKLDGEITKMIDAGHLRPGSVNLGLATGTGACGTQLADYFHDPSETIHALMLALPHVSSNVQGRLRAYIQQEMASYPPYRYEHLGFSSGAKRERYPTPPDLAPVLAGISPSDEDYTEFPGYGRNPFMFYAMWEYARELGGARELFDASSGYLESPPSDSYLKENPNVFNQYVAGYYGYLQLESLAGDPESRSVRSEYDRLLSLRISTFTKDSSYAGANASEGDVYCRGFNVFSNFLYLTPELASSLRSRRSQVSAAVAEYERVAPFWFVSNVDEGFGENAISWLHDTNGIYMAKAWILQEPYAELARYIDNPGFERGDLFYIQKLVAALEAP